MTFHGFHTASLHDPDSQGDVRFQISTQEPTRYSVSGVVSHVWSYASFSDFSEFLTVVVIRIPVTPVLYNHQVLLYRLPGTVVGTRTGLICYKN